MEINQDSNFSLQIHNPIKTNDIFIQQLPTMRLIIYANVHPKIAFQGVAFGLSFFSSFSTMCNANSRKWDGKKKREELKGLEMKMGKKNIIGVCNKGYI